MVKCTECKFGRRSCYYDHYADDVFPAIFCEITSDWLSINQAEDDAPCDLYVQKLDDNETEESSA